MSVKSQPEHCRWGSVDRKTIIAEGIVSVSTASHGGIIVSLERAEQIKQRFPKFKSRFSSATEFEEDCDCRLVVVAFPEHFSDEAVALAVLGIKRDAFAEDSVWNHVDEIISQDKSESSPVARSDRWLKANMNNYFVTGSYSSAYKRVTYLKRIGDGKRLQVAGSFYTNILTAELVAGLQVVNE